jgi:phosphonate transport system ATP-binding protein
MPDTPLFALHQANLGWDGARVLQSVSLGIYPGEKVALVGKSGEGKSTLLHALWQQAPEQIALCPQSHGLVANLSVYNNIYMGRLDQHSSLYNLWNLVRPHRRHWQAVAELAEQLGLQAHLGQSVDRLSGGQKQRTALGRALYQERAVFFGDEPLSAVDPKQADELLQLLVARHPTLVIALHDKHLALTHFDRLIGLKHGRIWFDHPAPEVSDSLLDNLYA